MRLVGFVQVLLLLALAGYLLLVALENPAPVSLPLPLGRGELVVSTGVAVTAFTGAGAGYALLLLLPSLWRARRDVRRSKREREALEGRLTATLQARLASRPGVSPSEPAPPARSA